MKWMWFEASSGLDEVVVFELTCRRPLITSAPISGHTHSLLVSIFLLASSSVFLFLLSLLHLLLLLLFLLVLFLSIMLALSLSAGAVVVGYIYCTNLYAKCILFNVYIDAVQCSRVVACVCVR